VAECVQARVTVGLIIDLNSFLEDIFGSY
jgi:hypothetical protein